MTTLLWLQTGACGGDTMSILCADSPSLEELLDQYGIDVLWQPSLSSEPKGKVDALIEAILKDEQRLDVLCIEGSIMTGPNGSGLYDSYRGRSKMSLVKALAEKCRYLVAMGTCAAFGGVHAAPPNPTDCTGLQFDKKIPGGLLPAEWRSRAEAPVINVSGCPAHPNAMTKTLAMLASGLPLELDHLNRPKDFFQFPGASRLHAERVSRVRRRGQRLRRTGLLVLQPGLPGIGHACHLQYRTLERPQQ